MTDTILYALVGIVVLFYLRRFIVSLKVKHYTPAEVKQMIERGERLVLLDVRSAAERKQVSIKGSLHIPLYELARRSDELKRHIDKEIVCFCATGSRSVRAANILRKERFRSANLRGGITRWNLETREV